MEDARNENSISKMAKKIAYNVVILGDQHMYVFLIYLLFLKISNY